MSDRSRDVSRALTEVRTVHSRAVTALKQLDRLAKIQDGPRTGDWMDDWYGKKDSDHDRIVGALNEVVALLDEWQKTGRKRP